MKKQKENKLAVAPAKIAKVPKLKTGDDAEVASTFRDLFNGAQNGLRAVVAFGLYAEQVKLIKLKHGQFGNWVKGTLPEISWRSVQAHMQLATSVLESCGVKKLKPFFKSAACCAFEHSGLLLTSPEKDLPEPAIEIRTKIFELIDGKSARQLFSEFKQAEEDEGGNVKPKVGRMKGQGGASAAQRAAARLAGEAATKDALKLKGEEWHEWVDEHCDEKGFGSIDDDAWHSRTLERAEWIVSFYRNWSVKNAKGEK